MKNLVLLLLFSLPFIALTQQTQVVRGKVVEKESQYPMVDAEIRLVGTDNVVFSDENGKFRMEGVPLGRQQIAVEYTFFKPKTVSIIVTSGKEVILNLEMEDALTEMEGVEITHKKKGEVNNDMASVSAKSFSVEETDRYAGSRGDPARMASNFAGVQGADDSRNDIVVRGNSPLGVLWRVEGIDIPNPNHFAIPGSTGGPVSVLNNKMMANSDFFTGAFPAEYGNSTAGVFDLKLRNGNNENHEFTGQFGFLGTEIMAEGPLNKETGASYLLAYRYSTVSLFSALGIDIGTSAVPTYQDFSFKVNFPLKNEANLSLFAISGKSDIDILISNQKDPEEIDLYGENDRDQLFGTGMAVFGATYSKAFSQKSFLKSTTSGSIHNQHSDHNLVHRHIDSNTNEFVLDSLTDLMDYNFTEGKISNATWVNKKINKKNVLKYGLSTDFYLFNFQDSIDNLQNGNYEVRWDQKSTALMLRPYLQWKHHFGEDLTMNLGVHNTYYSQGNAMSIMEPRIGFKYAVKPGHSLNFGAGLHSQIQPNYTYFYKNETDLNTGNRFSTNEDMGLSKSVHSVLGYDLGVGKNARIRIETYYQYLYDIPVSVTPSSLSLINQGSGFSRFFPPSLVNEGTGQNYGLEFTLEKFFSKNYFYMFTASVYDSKFKGSDGIERDTDFNGNYAFNALLGYEVKVGKKSSLGLGAKFTMAGGKRYGQIDTLASSLLKEVIFLDEGYNENQFADYMRLDFKINFKINAKKVTHEIAVDLVNVLSIQNILSITYAPDNPTGNPFLENYQLGFLPIFYYKIDF